MCVAEGSTSCLSGPPKFDNRRKMEAKSRVSHFRCCVVRGGFVLSRCASFVGGSLREVLAVGAACFARCRLRAEGMVIGASLRGFHGRSKYFSIGPGNYGNPAALSAILIPPSVGGIN